MPHNHGTFMRKPSSVQKGLDNDGVVNREPSV